MTIRTKRGERGQTSLFMALFISTMILLFAFTTNIGMLVHAKINLQNAADAAAYAGAAVQARQLTAVGYLNWEMRRALKEFLFYYTVRGQREGLPCFPMDISGATNPGARCNPNDADGRYSFQINDFTHNEPINETAGDFLPTVCIIYNSNNNYCQKKGVAGIPEFPSGGGWGVADPIVASVRNATDQIISKKLEDCFSRTDVNRKFLISWLFNLNPNPGMTTISTGADVADAFPTSGLERIGVLPRMAMLQARINNFEELLNMNLQAEGSSLTIREDSISQFKGMVNANRKLDYFERPLQAFLSAKNNLVGIGENGIFGNIELTELLPTSPATPSGRPKLA
ncbi:MAG: pilus assembly protein TadG-related protein [Bdellovibrionota bacterium]